MFRLCSSHNGRGVNTNTVITLLLSPWDAHGKFCRGFQTKPPSPLCSAQSVKQAGRLVCAQTDAGHGAHFCHEFLRFTGISALQDVLLQHCSAGPQSNSCRAVFAEQDWDLGLLSPALSWGKAFIALRFSWSLTNDALAETNTWSCSCSYLDTKC